MGGWGGVGGLPLRVPAMGCVPSRAAAYASGGSARAPGGGGGGGARCCVCGARGARVPATAVAPPLQLARAPLPAAVRQRSGVYAGIAARSTVQNAATGPHTGPDGHAATTAPGTSRGGEFVCAACVRDNAQALSLSSVFEDIGATEGAVEDSRAGPAGRIVPRLELYRAPATGAVRARAHAVCTQNSCACALTSRARAHVAVCAAGRRVLSVPTDPQSSKSTARRCDQSRARAGVRRSFSPVLTAAIARNGAPQPLRARARRFRSEPSVGAVPATRRWSAKRGPSLPERKRRPCYGYTRCALSSNATSREAVYTQDTVCNTTPGPVIFSQPHKNGAQPAKSTARLRGSRASLMSLATCPSGA